MTRLLWQSRQGGNISYAQTETHALTVSRSSQVFEWSIHDRTKGDTRTSFIASGTIPISTSLAAMRRIAQSAAEQELARIFEDAAEMPAEQPNVRIYFDGCEGSGKTTLARKTAKRYGLPLLTEVASAVLYEFQQRVGEQASSWDRIRADADLSSEVQPRVFERQLADERALPPPAVYDRTLSCLAYAELYADNFADLLERVPSEYIENLRQSIVFLVRPQRELLGASDGIRAVVSWEAQVRVDQTIETLLKTWRVRPVYIDTLSAVARRQQIDWCLEARGFRRAFDASH